PTPMIVDFRTPTTSTFTDSLAVGDRAQVVVSQGVGMRAGNTLHDDRVVYQGTGNDINRIYLLAIDAADNEFQTPLFILKSYNDGDVNMDGETIFTGNGNDVEFIY
ncbi:MAG: hypothetical protein QMB24_16040, partial [Spirosomataceae bacterium]